MCAVTMPPVNRNKPQKAIGSDSSYSVMEFMREFPDDRACLDWLWRNHHAPDGRLAICPKARESTPFTGS